MSEYQISVITPFHNVDMGLFKQAAASMKKQTVGFENIEWIIVVHNCEAWYLPELQKMLGEYPNVILHELNNDARTASSPRNCGMRLATAPYIGFLDGDDGYTPEALKTALEEIQSTRAQIVIFRMEYELADDLSVPIPDLVLWNQCRERIVIERDNWDNEKMFSGMFGWVTSRLYDRNFLMDQDLFFDEDLVLFEDFHMLFRAIGKADKLVYLPQTIGYHYMINNASTLQSRKNGETLVRYAIGLKKLYTALEESGIESDFVERSCLMLSVMMLGGVDISTEQRLKIKELLGPFVEKFKPFPVNKLRTPEMVEQYYRIPKEVILNTDESLSEVNIKDSTDGRYALAAIVRRCMDTDFGQNYSFRTMNGMNDFRNSVPLMEPKDLTKLVRLQTNIGEFGILTNERVTRYFVNGFGEYIPSVDDHFRYYVKTFAATLTDKTNLLLAYRAPVFGSTNDYAMIGTLQNLMVMEYFTRLYLREKKRATRFTSPVGAYFNEETGHRDDFFYQLMKDALMNRELDQIVAFSTEDVLAAFRIVDENRERMIAEIRQQDEARASELEGILADMDSDPVARRIWPGIQRIVAFGAGEQAEYTRGMKRYTGDVPHNNGYYYTEEAILGYAVADDSDLFEKTLLNVDFYELRSLADDKIVLFSEAEIGKPYQIIITSQSGLYRYTTQHFIRIKEKLPTRILYTIY